MPLPPATHVEIHNAEFDTFVDFDEWEQMPSTNPRFQLTRTAAKLNLTSLDEAWVAGQFGATAGPYRLRRVEMISNAQLQDYTLNCLCLLESRRDGPGPFNPTIGAGGYGPNPDPKSELLGFFKHQRITDTVTIQTFRNANVFPAWHGAAEQKLRSIARTGFASLALTDAGYFGHGIYSTAEAAYACKYASTYPGTTPPNADGEWCAMFCLLVTGVAYPITLCPEDFPALPAGSSPNDAIDCKWFGAPIKSPYDTHVVCVRGPHYLATNPHQAEFHEYICKQDAQLLPVALVFFTT
eukprot:TRINITY_DN10951_c0_g1_i3.p1 TRINITY_DN10951_c0_g1~~TRINITY_DN10951_c0_g1_i3.p1  ORF type:complete len:296 (+),score=28.62 TRINITY_DN10951_c0_g1_i3:872-1759(+)